MNEKILGFVLALAAAGAALPAALFGLRFQVLRHKKRSGTELSDAEWRLMIKNAVIFVVCLLAVYGLGFASIRCFR